MRKRKRREREEREERSVNQCHGDVWGRGLRDHRPDAIEAPFRHSAQGKEPPCICRLALPRTRGLWELGIGNIIKIRQAEAILRPK